MKKKFLKQIKLKAKELSEFIDAGLAENPKFSEDESSHFSNVKKGINRHINSVVELSNTALNLKPAKK